MSGFENYPRELAELDHEIRHYAAVCDFDLAPWRNVEACLEAQHDIWTKDPSHETLRGLLFLRLKVETEMLEQGLTPPPLVPAPPIPD